MWGLGGGGGWPAGERADVPWPIDDEFGSLSLLSSAAAVAAFVAVVAEELRCCEVLRGAWNDPGLIVAGFAVATFAGLSLLSSTAEGRGKQASANTCMQIDDRELHFHEQLA
ncbi:unnamed protein product [Sphagnum tenellum]